MSKLAENMFNIGLAGIQASATVPCSIVEQDLGDEDKKVIVYEVIAGGGFVASPNPFQTRQAAAEWANAQGYTIQS